MKRSFLVFISGLLLLGLIAFVPGIKRTTRFLITDYGAKGDSSTLNTTSIQAAINDCSAKGGGEVVIPKGIFLSGAIFLKKGVNLLVETGALLKGSADPADYPQINTRWEGEERVWTSAFVNAIDLDGTTISGEGTIDGSGDIWLKNSRLNKNDPSLPRLGRPRMICFQNCKNVKIGNLNLHNEAVWCLHILYCTNVSIENLHITADHDIPSSDGIDIDSSTGVDITGCSIDVNDDCISIKSGKDEDGLRVNRPSQDITISFCHLGYGHGGVAMGSETSGGIRNVVIKNCLIDSQNWAPIRFKSQPSRGGVVENITYEDITLHDTRKAFEFNMAWRMVGKTKPPSKVPPVVQHILIKNIIGHATNAGEIIGLENSPIRDVKFVNCKIMTETDLVLRNVTDIDTSGLQLFIEPAGR